MDAMSRMDEQRGDKVNNDPWGMATRYKPLQANHPLGRALSVIDPLTLLQQSSESSGDEAARALEFCNRD